MGGGIVKIRRTWATIPSTRNEVEQYTYAFPGFSSGRNQFPFTVMSRLQYDYFLFDDWGVYGGAVYPAGIVLNASTGIYPAGLIIPAQYYYSGEPGAVANNNFTTPSVVDDGVAGPPVVNPSIPSLTDYLNLVNGVSTSNGLPGEIVAESSTMNRWMGNIFERRTRFVLAQ